MDTKTAEQIEQYTREARSDRRQAAKALARGNADVAAVLFASAEKYDAMIAALRAGSV